MEHRVPTVYTECVENSNLLLPEEEFHPVQIFPVRAAKRAAFLIQHCCWELGPEAPLRDVKMKAPTEAASQDAAGRVKGLVSARLGQSIMTPGFRVVRC
jgi:hypothetical protein